MGLIETTIALANPSDATLQPMKVSALVDMGALHFCIPEHIALQLKLKELEKREVILADGKRQLCSYSGPIKVTFHNRSCFVGALILGDSVLLGAIPMEDMGLMIEPAKRKAIVNPQNPNMTLSSAK